MTKSEFIHLASDNGIVCCYSGKDRRMHVKRPEGTSASVLMTTIESWEDDKKAITQLKKLKVWQQ